MVEVFTILAVAPFIIAIWAAAIFFVKWVWDELR